MVIMGAYSKIGWVLRAGPTARHKTTDVLKKLEIYDIRNKQICDLSSVERQKAILARCLVKEEAEVFLMDEPLNGADMRTEQIFWELLKILKDNGKTVVAAYNNIQAADRFDLIYLINVRPIALGSAETVLTQENMRRAFGGKTGFWGADIWEDGANV
jgi:ABC-type Mn2+/Zn2+ transport system ATPase subunit